MATCCGLLVIMALFGGAMWSVVLTHYKHKQHPLVLKRFDIIFESLKRSSDGLLPNACLPLLVTKRAALALVIGLLYSYSVGPLIILAFIQLIVNHLHLKYRPSDISFGKDPSSKQSITSQLSPWRLSYLQPISKLWPTVLSARTSELHVKE